MSNELIEKYYHDTADAYERWGKGLHIHFGYDLGPDGHFASLEKLSEKVIEVSGVQSGHTVLDSGCGVGGLAVRLARDKGCYVVGTNVSENQITKALQTVRSMGLDRQVFILPQDYSSMADIEDNIFDTAIMCESFYHAQDKKRVIQSHHRVLKPGGTYLISDYFLKRALSEHEAMLLATFDKGWCGLTTALSNVASDLTETGFGELKISDITENMIASINSAAESAASHDKDDSVTDGRKNHREAMVALNNLMREGAMGYFIIKSAKLPVI